MTARLPTGSAAALAPVQSALLTRARADAGAVLDEARREADHVRAAARDRATQIIEASRAEGEAEARAAAAVALTRRRRQARDVVLAARRELFDELLRECRAGARALRDAPDYRDVRARLTRLAVATLGPDAVVEESPDGGVVAKAGGRRLDLTLPTLADREVERLGAGVNRLWAE